MHKFNESPREVFYILDGSWNVLLLIFQLAWIIFYEFPDPSHDFAMAFYLFPLTCQPCITFRCNWEQEVRTYKYCVRSFINTLYAQIIQIINLVSKFHTKERVNLSLHSSRCFLQRLHTNGCVDFTLANFSFSICLEFTGHQMKNLI